MTLKREIKFFAIENVTQATTKDAIYLVKAQSDSTFKIIATDLHGNVVQLFQGSSGGGITNITSSDNSILVTGSAVKDLKLSNALQTLINSALQTGDPITSLVNNAGYITLADIPTFVPGDYDLDDFTNINGDPFVRTSDLATVATSGDYGDLNNIPSTFPPSTHTHPISDITGLQGALDDKVDKATTVNGQPLSSNVLLNTDDIQESGTPTNKWWTNARGIAAILTGYTSGAGTISASDTILSAIQKLNGNISALISGVSSVFGRTGAITAQSGDYNASQITNVPSGNISSTNTQNAINELDSEKEATITASGNTTDFWSGSKTFRNLATDVRAVLLTGVSLATSQTIAETDTVLQALGYLQAQITANITAIATKVTGAASSTDNAITRFDGTTGKAVQNSLVTIDDNGAITVPGETSPSFTAKTIKYDNTLNQWILYDNDSNVALNVGYETWFLCTNNTGSSIPNGSVVYISGASSGIPTIALAKADSATTTVGIGITTETIANGATGKVTQSGIVNGVDTSALSAGAVYVSSTVAGGLTNTAPSVPNYRMRVGFVGVINATTGTILVTPSTANIDDKQLENFYYASKQIYINDDYISTNYVSGATNWNSGGTNASGGSRLGAQGVQTCSTGTGLTGAGGTTIGDVNSGNFYIGGGAISYERRIYIPTLSTSSERYIIFEGFQTNASFTNTTNAICFMYDEGGTYAGGASAGSANWKCVTINASTRTFTTTSTTVASGTYIKLRIEINAAGTSVTFYIDNNLVATHTTNIPATTTLLHIGNYIVKSVGLTARTYDSDYLAFRQTLTTAR